MMRIERDTRYRIRGPLKAGETVSALGRDYIYLGLLEPFTREDKRPLQLLLFKGVCSVCGDEFSFKAMKSRFWPYATCEDHRSVGRARARVG